jgi:FlaA1/EpsC-like NDP-sugar epimerase
VPSHNRQNLGTLFQGKRLLITGGTGSLGKILLSRILSGKEGEPAKVTILSRDEGKQHQMRVDLRQLGAATDDIVYGAAKNKVQFRIGDIRDFHSVAGALRDIDIVFNTAALKQVPTCEYFAYEALMTNAGGAENIVRAIRDLRLPVETVVGISTDKAVKPVNVMGMTKALQERIFATASLEVPDTRFIVVRYGNVLASRGSVIPLFHEQLRNGGPLTITHLEMTRFLLSLQDAVDAILEALRSAHTSEMYIPIIPSARIADVVTALIDGRPIKTVVTGIRPGEKMHEVLISEEEGPRTVRRGSYYVVAPILPELRVDAAKGPFLDKEYNSGENLMTLEEVRNLLARNGLILPSPRQIRESELLR